MKALLLAGGYGTRLQPLTNYLPKCLIPILGRPLLDYWLDALVRSGVKDILVNTHYLPSLVSNFITKSKWSEYVTIVHEKELLGTGGTIVKNREFFGDEPFIVAHADNLTIFNIKRFISAHQYRPEIAEITMMVFESDQPSLCGIVEIDELDLVQRFHEKVKNPPGIAANAAVYILEPSVVEFMLQKELKFIDFSTQVIPSYMGKIFTFQNTTYHRDIGNIESYIAAHKEFPVFATTGWSKKAWDSVLENIDYKSFRKIMDEYCLNHITTRRLIRNKIKQYS